MESLSVANHSHPCQSSSGATREARSTLRHTSISSTVVGRSMIGRAVTLQPEDGRFMVEGGINPSRYPRHMYSLQMLTLFCSDGVLNPQGIRFGSSDIYSVVESAPFNEWISTTLCVGRRRPHDTDESVFLFVIMKSKAPFTDDLSHRLRNAIRQGLSTKHVPRFIIPVREIPVTVNGKKVETLVKHIISRGELPRTISSTVSNRQCLGDFIRFYDIDRTKSRQARL